MNLLPGTRCYLILNVRFMKDFIASFYFIFCIVPNRNRKYSISYIEEKWRNKSNNILPENPRDKSLFFQLYIIETLYTRVHMVIVQFFLLLTVLV